jgi:hypothetical protein
MNKKGDISQLPVVLIILIIAAIVGFLCLTMASRVNTYFLGSGLMPENSTAQHATQVINENAPYTTDYMIFFLFLGSNLALIIGAVRTKFSPTIIFFFILLLIITIFIAAGFVNIYQGLTDVAGFTDIHNKLTLTNFIFSKYLPLIMTVVGILIMIVMWGKSGGEIIT